MAVRRIKKVKSTTRYKDRCDRCGKRAGWSFRGRDGKMHGACRKHLKEIK